MRNIIFIITTVIVFSALNILIYKKEATLKDGKTVFLDLAPVDPRSLIQGDYMILRYRLSQEIETQLKVKASGYVVLAESGPVIETNNVSTQDRKSAYLKMEDGQVKSLVPVRVYDGKALNANEHLLKYHYRNNDVQISAGKTDAYFFQEGHAKHYDNARYGSIKLSNSGEAVLDKLYDTKFNDLNPAKN
ncbi:GDYXXLXY domain-containing protein [Candidatus Uabimicrobium amorphum]|uniref:Membrane protein n=1 Tax=Uabimicrobium amorphum TaxID=2596890 RepID=A0A5S9III9_UABAM|nr:GDYXXLXY domain-containing protein [Candidatus Uabimicrobium amorphum]BBM82106.1 membrane protein [Candidatus Uabimicrobium amorphum]